MKFRLLPKAGTHSETGDKGQLRIYKAGDIVESAQDLVMMFPNKFQLVEDEEVQTPSFNPSKEQKAAVAEAAKKGGVEVSAPEEEEDSNPLGRNVTKRFPLAKEQDFLVFSEGGAFHVTEADDPKDPLNDKPLKRKDVEGFIEQYLRT